MKLTPIVLGLVLLLLAGCGPESDPRIGSDRDPSDWVFAPSKVRDYHLTIDPGDLATLDNITYVHARFQCEDEVLLDVGVRFKGNSSYWAGGPKYSFKVDFNRYSGQGVHRHECSRAKCSVCRLFGSTTPNDSSPIRPRRSPRRTFARRTSPTRWMTASPVAWPHASLIFRRRSMSKKTVDSAAR